MNSEIKAVRKSVRVWAWAWMGWVLEGLGLSSSLDWFFPARLSIANSFRHALSERSFPVLCFVGTALSHPYTIRFSLSISKQAPASLCERFSVPPYKLYSPALKTPVQGIYGALRVCYGFSALAQCSPRQFNTAKRHNVSSVFALTNVDERATIPSQQHDIHGQ